MADSEIRNAKQYCTTKTIWFSDQIFRSKHSAHEGSLRRGTTVTQ